MKISKTLVAITVAASLVLSGSIAASAKNSRPTPSPSASASATPEPISKNVDKHDKKAIQDARKTAGDLQKKLDKIALSTTDAAAIAAWQDAVAAWKAANADALAARKVIEKTLHDAVKASDKAVHDAQDAVKVAQKALSVAKVGGDAGPYSPAQFAVNSAINDANNAATREQVRTDALKAYNDAISALGALPAKPAKPVLGTGTGLGSDHGKNKGSNKKHH